MTESVQLTELKCAHCGAPISRDALTCAYCHTEFIKTVSQDVTEEEPESEVLENYPEDLNDLPGQQETPVKGGKVGIAIFLLFLLLFGAFVVYPTLFAHSSSNSYTSAPSATPYVGSLNVTPRAIFASDGAALSSGVSFLFLRMNGGLLGALELGDIISVMLTNQDAGAFLIAVETKSVFIDLESTVQSNSALIQSVDFKDVNNDGQYEPVFKIHVALDPNLAPQALSEVGFTVVTWKPMATPCSLKAVDGNITIYDSGDYHATGYCDGMTPDTELRFVKATLTVNSTAESDLIMDGSIYPTSFRFLGYGANSGRQYGGTWHVTPDLGALHDTGKMNLFVANWNEQVDPTQVLFGLPIRYEKHSGGAWLQYDLCVHVTESNPQWSNAHFILTLYFITPNGTLMYSGVPVMLTN